MDRWPGLREIRSGTRLSPSDEILRIKQVEASHAPDGREIEVESLLSIVEEIFVKSESDLLRASSTSNDTGDVHEETPEDEDALGPMSYVIDKLSREISRKALGKEDVHETSISLLQLLSSYTWDSKLVLIMLAFAFNYGEFCWLITLTESSDPIIKSIVNLKQLPFIKERAHEELKPAFDALNRLITVMRMLTKSVVEAAQLSSHEGPAFSELVAFFPTAIFWTVTSVMDSSALVANLTTLSPLSADRIGELTALVDKLHGIHDRLMTQLTSCKKEIDHMKYQMILNSTSTTFIDNMRTLKALIYSKDDILPLYHGLEKKLVNIEVLRHKVVLLLISRLDFVPGEIVMLEQIYNETLSSATARDRYDIVWIPIVDDINQREEKKQPRFDCLKSTMPWYSVCHPRVMENVVITFIKEKWEFRDKPILVVIDPHGKVVCLNALNMMWIWGSVAFPFTTTREEILWTQETWGLELLVDHIDPSILNWMHEGRYTCLYGGEDVEWIRKFTNTAGDVAQAAKIPLEMVYVGNSNPKERITRNIETIMAKNLSHCWESTFIWFFWVRIESMWRSKNRLGKTSESDSIMHEIEMMLSFDSSEGGWALFTKGTDEMIKTKGNLFLTCLENYPHWKDEIQHKGFLPSMKDYLQAIHTEHHCNRLILSGAAGVIPERMVCLECGRNMERFIMYTCCDE